MQLHIVGLVAILALALFIAPLVTDAQQPTKVARIGMLNVGRPPSGPVLLPRRSSRVSVTSATSRARTSSLSAGMRRGSSIDFPVLRLS
jgi:hypothetical protein